MPETRGRSLVITEGQPSHETIGGLKNGQLVLVDVEHDPKERGVGELYEVHHKEQRTNGLDANDVIPTHYPLTLLGSQIEPFMPVLQGIKDAPPILQITGRILDFTKRIKTSARSDEPSEVRYAIADTAHLPAIVKLRQIVEHSEAQGRVSQFKELIAGNGDIICIWEVGTMALKGVVGTTDVSPVDFLEVDAVPDIPSAHNADRKRPEYLTYDYSTTFTDLESYHDETLKTLLKPLLDGLKHPDSKEKTDFLHHLTMSMFNPDHKVSARHKKSVESVMTYLNNAHHHKYELSPIVSIAHSIARASLLIDQINLEEQESSTKKVAKSANEPTFSERRQKVWYELAHSFGFDSRLHSLHDEYRIMAKYAQQNDVNVFSRLRVRFRAHDDHDTKLADFARKGLEKHTDAHLNAALLKSFIAIDFNGQRKHGQPNFSVLGIAGTQLRALQDVHAAADANQKPDTLLAISTDNSAYKVVTPPYYPTEVANAFSSENKEFINTIPGVVSMFKVLLPEIENGLDSTPPTSDEMPLEYIATSIKYQPWIISQYILNSMFGTKEKYHNLRQAIKQGSVTWHGIFEQPRQQSWTVIKEEPIQAGNPRSLREVVAEGSPLYNGDALLYATDDEGKLYMDRGKIAGQKRRVRQLGRVIGSGMFVNDKKIARPKYTYPASHQKNRHQLEVIFAANGVYAYDGATGAEDAIDVKVPKHWKRVVVKKRKGLA